MDIGNIKALCRRGAVRYTNHVMLRILQRGIDIIDVETAIMDGEIIREYPEDYPYPSCQILGRDRNNQPLHTVCGVSEDHLWLITAYYPDADEWESDWATRRGNLK